MIIDIHTHRSAPYNEGVISAEAVQFAPVEGQLYSVGVHPWTLPADTGSIGILETALTQAAGNSQAVMIGETGFDTLRGAPMMLQTLMFRRHVELSEQLEKPLIVHCVKAIDMVLAWRRESRARQPWIVHGFRGKPQAAAQLLRAGCFLSFGGHFNAETLRAIPQDCIFAETDGPTLSIEAVIDTLSEARGADLRPVIEANVRRLLHL